MKRSPVKRRPVSQVPLGKYVGKYKYKPKAYMQVWGDEYLYKALVSQAAVAEVLAGITIMQIVWKDKDGVIQGAVKREYDVKPTTACHSELHSSIDKEKCNGGTEKLVKC